MPITIQTSDGVLSVDGSGFESEAALESAIVDNPNLLRTEGAPELAYVARQVSLPEAGIMDLLLVTAEGLPVAVEAKLVANSQARREVVAQVVDYVSALTTMTNEELDRLTRGDLSTALQSFGDDDAEAAFKRRWQALGANLRAGLARVIVAVDSAPPGLERIVRFLSEKSELDVQLVEIERYESADVGDIIVPTFLVVTESAVPVAQGETYPELLRVTELYNATASPALRAEGSARNYRQVHIAGWPALVHYEFYQIKSGFSVDLHLETEKVDLPALAEALRAFVGQSVAAGRGTILWDRGWSRGRLTVRFPYPVDEKGAAQAMADLIRLTQHQVDAIVRSTKTKSA